MSLAVSSAVMGVLSLIITSFFCAVVWFETRAIISTSLTGSLGVLAIACMWRYPRKCEQAEKKFEEENNKLKKNIETVEKERDDLKDLNDQQQRADNAKGELERLQSQQSDLKNKIDELEKQKNDLEQELKKCKEVKDDLQRKLEEAEKQKKNGTEMDEEMKKLSNSVMDMNTRIDQQQKEIESKNAENDELKKKIEEVEKERDEAKNDVEELKEALEACDKNVAELSTSVGLLKQFEEEINELQAKLEKAEKEKGKHPEISGDLEKERDELKQKNEELEQQNNKLKEQLKQTEKERDDAKSDVERIMNDPFIQHELNKDGNTTPRRRGNLARSACDRTPNTLRSAGGALARSGSFTRNCSFSGRPHVPEDNSPKTKISIRQSLMKDQTSLNKKMASFEPEGIKEILLSPDVAEDANISKAFDIIVHKEKPTDELAKLLDGKIDICFGPHKMTPLMCACFFGNLKAYNVLVAAGASGKQCDDHGRTLLHVSVVSGDKDLVKLVSESNASMIQTEDADHNTPMHTAVMMNSYDCLDVLANGSYNPKKIVSGDDGRTPLHLAIQLCDLRSVKLLLDHFYDIPDAMNNTPLHYVMYNYTNPEANTETCDELFSYIFENSKYDINAVNDAGETVLHLACSLDLVAFVEDLCNDGADVTKPNGDGYQPLHLAVLNNSIGCCEALLKHGAPVDGYELFDTPCDIAVEEGHLEVFKYLHERYNADVLLDNEGDGAPIHVACRNGFTDIVEYLIDSCGEDVNRVCKSEQQSQTGEEKYDTPLTIAFKNDKLDVVNSLLRRGANEDFVLPDGSSVGDLPGLKAYVNDYEEDTEDNSQAVASPPATPLKSQA